MPQTVYIKSGFTMVPNQVLLDTTLSALALRLFEALENRSGKNKTCWAGYPQLAQDVGCSVKWLPKVIEKLVKAGYLDAQYRKGKTYIFTLLLRVERPHNGTHAVSGTAPMQSVEYEQKPKQKPNEERASRPVFRLPEPTFEEKFAKTIAAMAGKKVRWSKQR